MRHRPAYLKEAFVGAALELAHEVEVAVDRSFMQRVMRHVENLKRYLSDLREPEKLAEMRDPSRQTLGFRPSDSS